jgi:diguanylate cyclase (GGDEF)-like protein
MAALQTVSTDTELGCEICESDRLAALQTFDMLDSPREEDFDRVTRLVQNIFGVKIATISMIDAHRLWYKSVRGMSVTEIVRKDTFCEIPVATGQSLVIPDTRLDTRFVDNPHVVGKSGIRFYAGIPLRTPEGQTIGTLCAMDDKPREFSEHHLKILQDLALIAMNELQLRQRATIDSLTGVLSRRAFKEEGARAVALAVRHRHRLSCISFDLDFFKTINDTYGHAAGDRVLVGVTRTCMGLLRQSDLIGRLGGEEFSILLPYADRQSALDVAEKLRTAIEGMTFELGGLAVSVTASFGVSTIDLATQDINTLLENADSALYEAKSAGRNRCVVSGTPDVKPKPVPRRVLKAGKIIFNNYTSVIDCTVRSLSEEGARIDVTASFGLPAKFVLAIRSDGFETTCRVVKQTERHLDVEFC